jgi:AcrR family transcriptional regulator
MATTTTEAAKGATRLPGPDRRYRILQAAVLLFSEKGFDATTTREIARAAGISEAVIFRHFQSKDELYAAILRITPDAPPLNEWLTELAVYAERGTTPGSSLLSPPGFWSIMCTIRCSCD